MSKHLCVPLRLCALVLIFLSFSFVPARAQNDDIDTRIASMTLEQKVAQTFMVSFYGESLTFAAEELLATWQPGAVVLVKRNVDGRNPAQIASLTNSLQETVISAGGLPLLIATDQEGGRIQRLRDGFTVWPAPALLTATQDADIARRVGGAMGAEMLAVGINMNLAPVADLDTNPDNPIINRRSPGSDAAMVADTLVPLIDGLRESGVVATVKHFPGHGDTSEDSHVTLPEVAYDLAALEARELVPFAAAIEADVGAVMPGHLWMSAFDHETTPGSLSYNVVTGILRERMGYDGLVITDALDMDAIDTVYSPGESAIRALLAGNDVILIGANVGEAVQAQAIQDVVDAVRAGRISEARIDESVRRILRVKRDYGVLDWQAADESPQIDLEAHAALLDEVFAAGVTVAIDREGRIPLDEAGTVGVVYPANRARIWTACRAYRDDIRWYAVSDSPTEEEINTAWTLAAGVDTVVVFTRDAYTNPAQAALVNALPPEKTAVVALISAYDVRRFPGISAYMMAYSALDPAIDNTCAILFGAQPARGSAPVAVGPF